MESTEADIHISLRQDMLESSRHIAIRWTVWYNTVAKARKLYDEDTVCLPREDFPEFLKTLVPLRKFAFLN